MEPIHRSSSVHGSIAIHATAATRDDEASNDSLKSGPAQQALSLPFFASVCRSHFTAALIDPVSGLASGAQQSSGRLTVDFGNESVVGGEYHRDILLVNRSEIELVWTTDVTKALHKDAAWFSLRDLDSENVFGVDTSAQPVPLPALSSRHLRLELRLKSPIDDFDFEFVICNVNQSGNVVTCRAIGSGQAEASDASLKVISGSTVNFGQICDGVWAKKIVTCKNTGERPLDVHFSASVDHDVAFRLAGVAGDDMDDDLPISKRPLGRPEVSASSQLSRTSTKDSVRGRELSISRISRGASPSSSLGRASSNGADNTGTTSLPTTLPTDLSRHLGTFDAEVRRSSSSVADPSDQTSSSGREPSLPPSRPLSRVASRTSSYRYHNEAESDEDDTVDPPFFTSGEQLSTSLQTLHADNAPHLHNPSPDKGIPNQIEELTMRPGTEYRIFVLYRPARDITNPPAIAGRLRESSFKVFLNFSSASSRSAAKSRRVLNCTAESCTSLIEITSGHKVDFGDVTVGSSKATTISITNLSALSAKVEIAAISKVLSTNRNVVVIPPLETVEEKLEFFPRRINDRYEKQMFVRNLLNRANGV